MTVVRPLPELSYATGIAAKLTARSSDHGSHHHAPRADADGVSRRHLFPREILQIRPTTSPPLQGVESDIEVALQIIESTVDVVCKRAHRRSESTDYCCDQIPG